jgi:predicted DNA-binding ribbon-helix-helix protein
MASGVVSHN